MPRLTYTITFTDRDVAAALHRAVDDYGPDWVDPNAGPDGTFCLNTYTQFDDAGNPKTRHCIAAWAVLDLVKHNVPDQINEVADILAEHNHEDISSLYNDHLREVPGLAFTDEAIRLLGEGQGVQDTGVPWGEVVERVIP